MLKDALDNNAGKPPRHLRWVGILALVWTAMGCFDYLMTQTRNEGYMGRFTAEELEFFYSIPAWAIAAWAIAVWGGLLGAVLLLRRKALAQPVFLVSLLATLAAMVQNYLLSNGLKIMGSPGQLAFTAAIVVVAIVLFLYAKAMRARGVLR
jgi:hypothetical protein